MSRTALVKLKNYAKGAAFVALAAGMTAYSSTTATAQSDSDVRLLFGDGNDISGELLFYGGGNYTISTLVGTIVVPEEGVSCVGAACPAGTQPVEKDRTLVLTSLDGSVTVSGTLVEIENDQYVLETDAGIIRVNLGDVDCSGAFCAGTEIAADPEPAAEEPAESINNIVLTSLDGASTLTGSLLGVEDEQYVIATDAGELRISARSVTCEGEGCIELEEIPAFGGEVKLVSATSTLDGTLIDMIEDAYIVDIPNLGVVRVRKDTFSCEGPGCP